MNIMITTIDLSSSAMVQVNPAKRNLIQYYMLLLQGLLYGGRYFLFCLNRLFLYTLTYTHTHQTPNATATHRAGTPSNMPGTQENKKGGLWTKVGGREGQEPREKRLTKTFPSRLDGLLANLPAP